MLCAAPLPRRDDGVQSGAQLLHRGLSEGRESLGEALVLVVQVGKVRKIGWISPPAVVEETHAGARWVV